MELTTTATAITEPVELFSLARRRPEETPTQKYIRAFARGGKISRAEEFFREELLKMVKSDDSFGEFSLTVSAMMVFGNEVFGAELAKRILDDCIKQSHTPICKSPAPPTLYEAVH